MLLLMGLHWPIAPGKYNYLMQSTLLMMVIMMIEAEK